MTKKNWKAVRRFMTGLLAVTISLTAAFVFCLEPAHAAPVVYNQKGNALKDYNAGKYKVVKNKKLTRKRYRYAENSGPVLRSIKGTSAVFTRYDAGLKRNGVIDPPYGVSKSTPQSMAVSPDGQIAYLMCVYKGAASKENSWKGYVVKYSIPQKKVLKKGPVFTTGHGQAMAMNPKNGQLWFIGAPKKVKTNLQQIDTNTLLPVKRINFKLKSTVPMGNNLAFDKKGNVYFYTRSNGGWAPKHCLKIYKGKIKARSVSFKLIMQGIKNPPGQIGQSLGYNPRFNRLYFVDDGEIISVPVSKLGKLKKKHVRTTVFSGAREFESITFDRAGRGYFLTNRPYEIMKVSAGF